MRDGYNKRSVSARTDTRHDTQTELRTKPQPTCMSLIRSSTHWLRFSLEDQLDMFCTDVDHDMYPRRDSAAATGARRDPSTRAT